MVDLNMVQKKFKQVKYRRFLSNLKRDGRRIVKVRTKTMKNVSYLSRFKNLNKTMFGSKICASSPSQFYYFLRSLWLRKFINTFIISGGKKKSAKLVMKTLFFLKYDEFLNDKRTFRRFFKISKNLLRISSLRVSLKNRLNLLSTTKLKDAPDGLTFWNFGWRPYSWYFKNSFVLHKKFSNTKSKLPLRPRAGKLNKFGISGWYWVVSVLDILRLPIFSKVIYIGYTPKIASRVLTWSQQFSLVFTWFRKVLVARRAFNRVASERLFDELDYSTDSTVSTIRAKRDIMIDSIESARKYNHFRWGDRVASKARVSKLKKKIFLWYSRGFGKINPYNINILKISLFSKLRKQYNTNIYERKNKLFSKLKIYNLYSGAKIFPFFLDTFKYFVADDRCTQMNQRPSNFISRFSLNKKSFRNVGYLNDTFISENIAFSNTKFGKNWYLSKMGTNRPSLV